jgi:hypothetical protein
LQDHSSPGIALALPSSQAQQLTSTIDYSVKRLIRMILAIQAREEALLMSSDIALLNHLILAVPSILKLFAAQSAPHSSDTSTAQSGSETADKAAPCQQTHVAFIQDRQKAIRDLKAFQDEVLTDANDRTIIQTYCPYFLELGAAIYAAQTAEGLDLLRMRLGQMKAAWAQVKSNLEKRQTVLQRAAILFALVTLAFIILNLAPNFIQGMELNLSAYIVPVVNVPLYVIFWSAMGSSSAVLYRVNRAIDVEREDPGRLLITQPIIGTVLGTVSYLIVHLGLLTLASDMTGTSMRSLEPLVSSPKSMFFFSLIAFLVGFSDRFADTLLRSLVGRFGGDKNAELISSQLQVEQPNMLVLRTLAQVFQNEQQGRTKVRVDPKTEPREEPKGEVTAEPKSHSNADDPTTKISVITSPMRRARKARNPAISNGQPRATAAAPAQAMAHQETPNGNHQHVSPGEKPLTPV